MNQILITEKVIVTKEMRKRKKFYKRNFFLSIFLVCILFSYYIYAEYDRNKSEQVSQQILLSLQEMDDMQEEENIPEISEIYGSDNSTEVEKKSSLPKKENDLFKKIAPENLVAIITGILLIVFMLLALLLYNIFIG